MAGAAWSLIEVDAIIADYFAMLLDELAGRPYSKAAHRRALLSRLQGRSEGSVEFKHRNISAVLCELRLPYIIGYKPAYNYQHLLVERISAALHQFGPALQQGAMQFLRQAPEVGLVEVSIPPLEQPKRGVLPPQAPFRFDFSQTERKRIGDRGEALIYEHERARVGAALGSTLAEAVVWAARDEGDGLGYDIRSIDVAASERTGRPVPSLIEVKTTTQGASFPFFLSANEHRVSQERADTYRLCRVFDLNRKPRFFTLPARRLHACRMEPVSYRVRLV